MLAEAKVGERWGYREKGDAPLLEAVVEAVDYDNPQSPRVKLHFPGAQPVVMRDSHPAGRLKCRWEDHEDFLAAEENWENLVYSDRVGDPVMEAVHRLAFEAVIPWDVAEEADSTIHVSDPDRFAELTGIPLAELAAIDGAFWTDGVRPERARRVSYHESTLYGRQGDTFHLPRGAMDRVARALRDRYAEAILRDVDEQEERARLARVTGYLGESYVGVDDAVASDEKPSGRPARDLIR